MPLPGDHYSMHTKACAHRCLSIEAPAPEDKLATLSEIAQEYGVEWDAHRAARDMLPAVVPPGEGVPAAPGFPPSNPSGAWGAGAGGDHPPPTGPPGGGAAAPSRFPGGCELLLL